MVSEHIVIADELYDHSVEPTCVTREELIRNRIRSVVTHLYFYDEGCLRVHQSYKGKRIKEHLLELRFLSPNPQASGRSAMPSLLLSLGLGLVAALVAFVLPKTLFSSYTITASVVSAALALVALLVHLDRREVRYRFVTANGRAVVLTLSGSFGCMRRTRAAVRMIREAINRARKDSSSQAIDDLRAEMKAHYKLAENGVITQEACADGTRLILSKFNH